MTDPHEDSTDIIPPSETTPAGSPGHPEREDARTATTKQMATVKRPYTWNDWVRGLFTPFGRIPRPLWLRRVQLFTTFPLIYLFAAFVWFPLVIAVAALWVGACRLWEGVTEAVYQTWHEVSELFPVWGELFTDMKGFIARAWRGF